MRKQETMTTVAEPTTIGGMLDDQLASRLLYQRIIVLGTEVDDRVANRLCAQLLLLSAEHARADISLYINSPGGSVTAGLAIYDTMQLIPNDVRTLAMGLAGSMGQFLLCAGAAGKRFSLPNGPGR
jgi:ATP-dependent Clp protease protease subunit